MKTFGSNWWHHESFSYNDASFGGGLGVATELILPEFSEFSEFIEDCFTVFRPEKYTDVEYLIKVNFSQNHLEV